MGIARNTVDLGAGIRAARRAAGLTQEQLAVRAGVSRRWISSIESTHVATADLETVFRILEALDLVITVTPDPNAGEPNILDMPNEESW